MSLKDYVPVNARIMQFRETFPDGFITTEVSNTSYGEKTGVRFVAKIFRNLEEAKLNLPASTGHSELILDDEKVLEKAETVAVGRAIALLGFSIKESIASEEEMDNFNNRASRSSPKTPTIFSTTRSTPKAAPAPEVAPPAPEEPSYSIEEEVDEDESPENAARSQVKEFLAAKAKAKTTVAPPAATRRVSFKK